MPQAAVWILLALAAALVGAAIPVLLQLRRTLRVAEDTLRTTGQRLDETLGQLSVTLERVNRASAELEHGVQRVSSLLEALGGVGDTLGKMKASLGSVASVGASLGGVIVSALRAAFGRDHEEPAESRAPVRAAQSEPLESEEVGR